MLHAVSTEVSKVLGMQRSFATHAKEWTQGWAVDRQFVGYVYSETSIHDFCMYCFSHINCSEFLVLTHGVSRLIISGGGDESSVMFLEHTVAVTCSDSFHGRRSSTYKMSQYIVQVMHGGEMAGVRERC